MRLLHSTRYDTLSLVSKAEQATSGVRRWKRNQQQSGRLSGSSRLRDNDEDFLGVIIFVLVSYKVYSAELVMALRFALHRPINTIKTVTMFTDNQAAIRSSSNLTGQSGQQILRYIVNSIDNLRRKDIEVELHWVPAHLDIEGNERADAAAKQATGWRDVQKRNKQLKEIDTQWKAASPPDFPFLRTAINSYVTQLLCEECAQDWKEDTRGKDLFRIAPTFTQKSTPHTQRAEEMDQRHSRINE